MSNIFINLQTEYEPHETGTIMLSTSDYEVVQLGFLPDMLDELIIHNSSGISDIEFLDRDAIASLTPLLNLFAEFAERVAKLQAACTPELQAKLDAAIVAVYTETEGTA